MFFSLFVVFLFFVFILSHYHLSAIHNIDAFGQILRAHALAYLLTIEVKHATDALVARDELA